MSKIGKWFRRTWSAITQPGGLGMPQAGDWRVVYQNGTSTRWMAFGDAEICKDRHRGAGRLQWRGDLPDGHPDTALVGVAAAAS